MSILCLNDRIDDDNEPFRQPCLRYTEPLRRTVADPSFCLAVLWTWLETLFLQLYNGFPGCHSHTMLSRSQFQAASGAFARRHQEWRYVEGHHPGYGYLTRTTSHCCNGPKFLFDDEALSEIDDIEARDNATASTEISTTLTVQEYIVYSASFNVPAFYFTAHTASVL